MEYSVEVRRRFAAALAGGGEPAPGGALMAEAEAEDRTLGVWARAHIGVSAGRIVAADFDVWGCPDTIAAAHLTAERLPGQMVEGFTGLDIRSVARELDIPTEKLGKLVRLEEAAAAALDRIRARMEKGIDNGNISD